jgi:predicted phage replisome organizer
MSEKKYYWLKLKRDFFKRHDIRILESMPNGKEIVLFYLKMLTESIDHEGKLRFSDTVPYTPKMLSVITNTDEEIVEDAITALIDLELMDILLDGTYILKETQDMIGFETEWAKKKRQYRESIKTEEGQVEDKPRTKKDNVRQEIEKEIDIEKDIESREKRKRFVPPTLEEVKAYCQERKNNVDPKRFFDYYQQGQWKDSKGNPVKNWKQKLITWENKQPKVETKKSWQGVTRTDIDFEELKRRCVVN